MPQLDYHKVVGILARTFESEADLTAEKTPDKSEQFTVTLRDRDGKVRSFVMNNGTFNIHLQTGRSQFDEKEFERWIRVFEYELEQAFKTNIKVNVDIDPTIYKITVSS